MNATAQIFGSGMEFGLPGILLAILGGLAVFALFAGLVVPSRGKPKAGQVKMPRVRFKDFQTKLNEAQIEVSASEYVRRSLTMGIMLGGVLFLLIGSVVLLVIGVIAGFMFTWTKLEQERDRKQVRYNKQLASACDTIRTAYGVNPSLKKALEAVAEFGQAPVKEDFQEILLYASQERLSEGLQAIASRRRSIVFDTVATALIRASEASGEVNDMLSRLAESTRQNVGAFEDAVTSQLNARSNVQWGTYGPWMIFCIFRMITLPMSMSSDVSLLGPMSTFFSSPGGNLLALFAALITIGVYRYALNVSQRGLVVRRVEANPDETSVRVGQKPLGAQKAESVLSAQARPVGAR